MAVQNNIAWRELGLERAGTRGAAHAIVSMLVSEPEGLRAPSFPNPGAGFGLTSRTKEEPMGRIVVTEFVALDGVVEDPGGVEGFKHGGWSFEFARGDDGDRFKLDETLGSDALLLGRASYEVFADSWPSRETERGKEAAC